MSSRKKKIPKFVRDCKYLEVLMAYNHDKCPPDAGRELITAQYWGAKSVRYPRFVSSFELCMVERYCR